MKITTVTQQNSGLIVARFDPKELLNNLDTVKLAIVPATIDTRMKEPAEKYLERTVISPNGITYCIYHDRTIKIHDPPKPSGSPNSGARYYVWDDNTGLLLQLIPPNKKSSCNYHRITDESFYNVKEECSICLPEGEEVLNGTYHVGPYRCHRLSTLSNPAINIILMNPPGLGLSDHYHPERCVRGLW